MSMKPYELERKTIISKEAKELGTVTGVEIDSSTWNVTHLQVGLVDRVLHSLDLTHEKKPGEKFVEILIPTKTVEMVADLIVLNISIDELKTIVEERNLHN